MLYRAEEYSKGLITGGTLFEELGFFYLGPLDGHKLEHLVPVLENIKSSKLDKPIFLHIITKKGWSRLSLLTKIQSNLSRRNK